MPRSDVWPARPVAAHPRPDPFGAPSASGARMPAVAASGRARPRRPVPGPGAEIAVADGRRSPTPAPRAVASRADARSRPASSTPPRAALAAGRPAPARRIRLSIVLRLSPRRSRRPCSISRRRSPARSSTSSAATRFGWSDARSQARRAFASAAARQPDHAGSPGGLAERARRRPPRRAARLTRCASPNRTASGYPYPASTPPPTGS